MRLQHVLPTFTKGLPKDAMPPDRGPNTFIGSITIKALEDGNELLPMPLGCVLPSHPKMICTKNCGQTNILILFPLMSKQNQIQLGQRVLLVLTFAETLPHLDPQICHEQSGGCRSCLSREDSSCRNKCNRLVRGVSEHATIA